MPLKERTARRLDVLAGDDSVVSLSQEELARMVGSTREAVGRILNVWKRDGLIAIGYARIEVLDRERLRTEGQI